MKILKIGQQIYPNIWIRFIKILLKKQKNMPKETILQPKKKIQKKNLKVLRINYNQ